MALWHHVPWARIDSVRARCTRLQDHRFDHAPSEVRVAHEQRRLELPTSDALHHLHVVLLRRSL